MENAPALVAALLQTLEGVSLRGVETFSEHIWNHFLLQHNRITLTFPSSK
jgi:hypothetical protein